jgi:ankyrin repeat protein
LKRFLLISLAFIVFSVISSAWAGPVENEALILAAQNLDLSAVRAALEKGANPNTSSSKSQKPFTALDAVGGGMLGYEGEGRDEKALKIVEVLFDSGAKLSPFSELIFFSIAEGNAPLVGLLLDHGMSPINSIEGYTPPELAIVYGQPGIYNLLIQRGGLPVNPETIAQIVFVASASRGAIGSMKTAIKNGAVVDGTDPCGKTALINAVNWPMSQQRLSEAIGWLLDQGADPNLEAKTGSERYSMEMPLHLFIKRNTYTLKGGYKNPEIKKLAEKTMNRLIKAGAKISGIDSMGRTPLHVAASTDNVRAAEILIQGGAKIKAKDDRGKTPLDYAESAQMIKLLKKNGAVEK